MSRNLQRKSSATPAQKTVQKSSVPTDESSDDDGYEGVDQISDSEDDDEPDVEAAEEDVMKRAFQDEALTPRPESDDDSVVDLPSPSFFNEHVEAIEPNYSSSSSSTAGSPDRRVHFDLSDDDSESGDDKEYPDITFFDLDSLAPHFRQLIDEDDKEANSDNEGWWPSEESEEDAADEAEAMDSDSSESSGYSTDEGETTDEDIPATIHAPTRSVLRRISDASSSEDEAPARGPVQKKRPKLSPFIHDGKTRYAMLDSSGKKMIMFGPNRRYSADGPTKRPQLQQQMSYDQMALNSSPMISNSGNLMMTAMSYNQDFSLFGGQAMGPQEAFFPFEANNGQENSSVEYEDDESDPEDNLNLDTFFDFGEESDEDQEADEAVISPTEPSTPAQATRMRSEDQVHPLLHLNSGVVGQFREKHTHKNVKRRNQVSTAALAFEGPYNQGPIQGLKPNRLRHANEPITPMPRKLKPANTIGSSPGSPLANVAQANKKRKFNGQEFHGHKRNKSLV
jgi:hypothetical protein